MSERRLPKIVADELARLGVNYHVEVGKTHLKVYVGSEMVGVLARGARKDTQAGRGGLNLRAQIRRAARKTAAT